MEESLCSIALKFKKGLLSRRDFIKHISDLILSIPHYKGYFDQDLKYDFFSVVLSKIDKIISCYNLRQDCKFETWLNLVLRRTFYNFIKKRNIRHKRMPDECSLRDDFIHEQNENIQDGRVNDAAVFDFLTDKEKNVIACKYGIRFDGRDISETAGFILHKMDKKKKIREKIYGKYHKILMLQKEITGEEDNDKINKLKEQTAKLMSNKRKLEKILHSYSVLPSNQWVGSRLGVTGGTIGSYLYKIKNKIVRNCFYEVNKIAN